MEVPIAWRCSRHDRESAVTGAAPGGAAMGAAYGFAIGGAIAATAVASPFAATVAGVGFAAYGLYGNANSAVENFKAGRYASAGVDLVSALFDVKGVRDSVANSVSAYQSAAESGKWYNKSSEWEGVAHDYVNQQRDNSSSDLMWKLMTLAKEQTIGYQMGDTMLGGRVAGIGPGAAGRSEFDYSNSLNSSNVTDVDFNHRIQLRGSQTLNVSIDGINGAVEITLPRRRPNNETPKGEFRDPTHGIFVDENGNQIFLRSRGDNTHKFPGEQESNRNAMIKELQDLGVWNDDVEISIRHVEGTAALMLRSNPDMTRATVVINHNRICSHCFNSLQSILLPHQTLNVVRIANGVAQPAWPFRR